MPSLTIRAARAADAPQITQIDAACLATGQATFRDVSHDWSSFYAAFGSTVALVATREARVVAWAGVSRPSAREVYAGVGETSVYVDPALHGQGIGQRMMEALIEAAESEGFWTLTAQIFPENKASIALHQRFGFVALGMRRRLGRMSYGPMKGKWRDVMFLERRSSIVGTD